MAGPLPSVKEPHLAGRWYPVAPAELAQSVRELLAAGGSPRPGVVAVVVPHAAYPYSGPTAAHGFAAAGAGVRRAIVLAPSHFAHFRGAALLPMSGYRTPLGVVPIDAEATAALARVPLVRPNPAVFMREHALEIQLPLLQGLAPECALAPLLVGSLEPGEAAALAAALRSLLEPGTLLVASSDLTHYGRRFDYLPVPPTDAATVAAAVRRLDARALVMEAETRKPAAAPRRRAQRAVKHAHGLTVLEDISAITARSEDLQETLQRVVEVVAERVGTDVCSLYILDPRAQRLTLWATVGLDRNSIGKVTMSVEEGLTGMAIEKLEPVMAVDAITHPRYKFFPETGEEKYHSFLGVPIIERGTPIGVLVVQTLRRRKFSAHEIRILREIASKVGPIIVTARLMEDLKSKENERREFRRRMVAAIKRLQAYEKTADRAEAAAPGRGRARLNGLPAAPGFGRGQAHLLQPPVSFEVVEETRAAHAEEEKRRLKRALKESVVER